MQKILAEQAELKNQNNDLKNEINELKNRDNILVDKVEILTNQNTELTSQIKVLSKQNDVIAQHLVDQNSNINLRLQSLESCIRINVPETESVETQTESESTDKEIMTDATEINSCHTQTKSSTFQVTNSECNTDPVVLVKETSKKEESVQTVSDP